MKAAEELCRRDDSRLLDFAVRGHVPFQRTVASRLVVIGAELNEDPTGMLLADHNHMIETLSS